MSTPHPADEPLVPLPAAGRRFARERRVRLGDVTARGRLRLDALARYVQDVSNDDTVDAALDDDMAWVVRRTVIDVRRPAALRELVSLTTFCGGVGGRWAERRVVVAGERGADIDVGTLWVHLDLDSGRPKALPAQFHELYGEAAGGRTIRARLHLGAPPPDVAWQPWQQRITDLDVLGHMNNAVAWAVVEEELADRGGLTRRLPVRAEVEHPGAVEPHHDLLRGGVELADGGVAVWLVDAAAPTTPLVAARVRPLPA
ncbi:MAG TPA: acyl-ACP thioesterase domain-containing protein [Acidimicrobiales bacterium]|nr:acyl-ACP thioesterase domain-containing protein [Acidimicrobiales bacterium]